MAEFGVSRNVQIVGASGTVTGQNLTAIGKAAEGFVTGAGYSTLIDSPENKSLLRHSKLKTRRTLTSMVQTVMAFYFYTRPQ
jgi:hypothetical protein